MSNDVCSSAATIVLGQTVTGDTTHATNDYDPGSGGCTRYAETGPDVVYAFTPSSTASYTLILTPSSTSYDAALYVLTSCPPSGSTITSCLAGSDQASGGGTETLSAQLTAGTTYFIVVDSYGSTHGPFTLSLNQGCSGAPCGAGSSCCSGSCTSTSSDPNNCGSCGNVCDGGVTAPSCQSGRCILTLAVPPTGFAITGFAIDSNGVYWSEYSNEPDGGQAYNVDKAGLSGEQPVTLASGPGWPGKLAVNSKSVYWEWAPVYAGSLSLMSVAKSGGTAMMVAPIGWEDPGPLAADESNLYWVDDVGSSIEMVNLDGGTPVTLTGINQWQSAIALDATSVYWTDYPAAPEIRAIAKTGGTVRTLYYSANVFDSFGYGIAVDPSGVYWPTHGGAGDPSGIWTVGLDGGQATTTLVNNSTVGVWNPIAVDSNSVYWEDGAGLEKVAKSGGPPELVVQSGSGPLGSLAVDSTSVYWFDPQTNAIKKATPK